MGSRAIKVDVPQGLQLERIFLAMGSVEQGPPFTPSREKGRVPMCFSYRKGAQNLLKMTA
jgi:hypothetical protein